MSKLLHKYILLVALAGLTQPTLCSASEPQGRQAVSWFPYIAGAMVTGAVMYTLYNKHFVVKNILEVIPAKFKDENNAAAQRTNYGWCCRRKWKKPSQLRQAEGFGLKEKEEKHDGKKSPSSKDPNKFQVGKQICEDLVSHNFPFYERMKDQNLWASLELHINQEACELYEHMNKLRPYVEIEQEYERICKKILGLKRVQGLHELSDAQEQTVLEEMQKYLDNFKIVDNWGSWLLRTIYNPYDVQAAEVYWHLKCAHACLKQLSSIVVEARTRPDMKLKAVLICEVCKNACTRCNCAGRRVSSRS